MGFMGNGGKSSMFVSVVSQVEVVELASSSMGFSWILSHFVIQVF